MKWNLIEPVLRQTETIPKKGLCNKKIGCESHQTVAWIEGPVLENLSGMHLKFCYMYFAKCNKKLSSVQLYTKY